MASSRSEHLFKLLAAPLSPPAAAVAVAVVGLALGVGLAINENSSKSGAKIILAPDSVLMSVNGISVDAEEYEFGLSLIASDKTAPLSAADRVLAFERMLEEELLVQDAIATDLIRQDDHLRAAILVRMAEIAALSGAADGAPDRARDQRFQAYLEQLRRDADIEIIESP